MIKARHSKWAIILFDFYINRLLKKNFNSFNLLNGFPAIPENAPLIVTPNHFSWWDGFFIDFLFKKFSTRKIHIMMLEEQLKRYWFFQKLGAFSINLKNHKSIIYTFRYIEEKVMDTKNFVVFYPQGEIEPYDSDFYNLKEGLHYFLESSHKEIKVLPVSFKITYGNKKKPDINCCIGSLISSEEIVKDYDYFKKAFQDNIRNLNTTAITDYENNILE